MSDLDINDNKIFRTEKLIAGTQQPDQERGRKKIPVTSEPYPVETKMRYGDNEEISTGKISRVKPNKNQKNVPKWTENWTFIRRSDSFINMSNKEIHTINAFNMTNGQYVTSETAKKPTASKICMDNGYLKSVYDAMYAPFKEEIFKFGSFDYINSFNKNSIPKADNEYTQEGLEAINFVKKHIEIILPQEDGKRAAFFIDWLAHQNQNIGVKVRFAILIQSTIEGMGKSLLYDLLKICLGQENIGLVESKELKGGWSDWAKNKAVNVIEELKIAGQNRHEIINELKPLITNSDIPIRERNIGQYTVINTCNYLIFTNHKDALPLDDNDSRYWVNMHPIQTKEAFADHIKKETGLELEDYFITFATIIRTQAGQLKKWLSDHKISSNFKRTDRAPMTAEKEAMILNENEKIKGLAEARELLKTGDSLYNQDVFSTKHLFIAINNKLDFPLDQKEKNLIINKLGYLPHNTPIKMYGETLRFKTIRIMTSNEVKSSLNSYTKIL